jgi:hypothetical protein
MEERVKTSFIPKTSLSVDRAQAPKGNPVALANVIAAVILILTIVGAGGIFLFEQFTVQNIAAKRQSLERSRAAFEPATIKELSRLDRRIETGKNLLKTHVSVSKLFDEIERLTLATVRFGSFSYAQKDGARAIIMAQGAAASFNAVALQSGGFSKSAVITEPVFSNVNIGDVGNIQFDFTATVNADRLGYAISSESGATENRESALPELPSL